MPIIALCLHSDAFGKGAAKGSVLREESPIDDSDVDEHYHPSEEESSEEESSDDEVPRKGKGFIILLRINILCHDTLDLIPSV